MSKTSLIAIGGLLLLIAALVALLTFTAVRPAHRQVVAGIGFVVGFGVLGVVCLAIGLSSEIPVAHRALIKRKFTPMNLLYGLVLSGGSGGILYLFHNAFHVLPHGVLLGAMAGVPLGVFLMASVFENACVRCGRLLKTSTLRFAAIDAAAWNSLSGGDIPGAILALGKPVEGGRDRLDVSYCSHCRNLAQFRRPSKSLVVVTGWDASALIDLAEASH